MDLAKLLQIFEHSALPCPQLGTFEDPYEGRVAPQVRAAILGSPQQPNAFGQQNLRTVEMNREVLYASCWHLSECESAAMWSIYAARGYGMAIQSTVGRLKRAVAEEPAEVLIGEVSYSEHFQQDLGPINIIENAHRKRRSFEHERELRLSVVDFSAAARVKFVRVALGVLVERIHLAPRSEDWVLGLAQELVNRYALSVEVQRSGLYDAPIY